MLQYCGKLLKTILKNMLYEVVWTGLKAKRTA